MKARGLVPLAALAVSGALLVVPATAVAADAPARHPEPGAVRAPAGVPSSYVFTHHGWFHPSCVVRIGEDEEVGADQVVRGRADGAAHLSLSPCGYPRFDLHGRLAHAGAAAPEHLPLEAAGATYDGYIVYYSYYGTMPNAPILLNDLIVPPAPTDVADQDIAFFNGILTATAILQPVIDFNGETAKKWSVESEQCCINGNDLQTTPVVVAVGDTIRGTVTGTGCASSGICSNWAVTTADVTSGKSTTLNTTVVNEAPNGVTPASLESYGVTSCAMFPAGGESTFTGTTLTDSQGTVQTVKYDLLVMDGVDAEVPRNCGQAGKSSDNDFTLIYGTVTAGTGGSTGTGGAAGAKGTGGLSGTGGAAGAKGTGGGSGTGGTAGAKGTGGGSSTGGSTGGTGGARATGGVSGTGGSISGTGGARATGGVSGTGGQTGTGGSGTGGAATGGTLGTGGTTVVTGTGGGSSVSTGGKSGTAGHAGGTGGAATGSGDTNDGSSSGGCSCDTSGTSTPGFSPAFLFLAAAFWNRRRRC